MSDVCACASVAVQATVVWPTGTGVPAAGVQVMPTGAAPPVTCGMPYASSTGCPVVVRRTDGAPHVSVNGVSTGGLGWVGVGDEEEEPPPQDEQSSVAASAART